MRVLIKTKDIVKGQPLTSGIDRLRRCVRESLDMSDGWKAAQPLASGHPPFTGAVLPGDLIPPPTKVSDLFWKIRENGSKSLAVELIDKMLRTAAYRREFASPVFKNSVNPGCCQAVSFGIGRKAAANQLHGAAAVGSEPEIAVAILSQCLHKGTTQTIQSRISPKLPAHLAR